MNSKDRDIKKLKTYIKSLGLKLYIKPYSRYTGLAEYVSGQSITLFNKKTTKTDIIMSLLHELGHYHDELVNKVDLDIKIALFYLSKGSMVGNRKDIPKYYRKIILKTERDGVKYMTRIHKLLKLEIPYSLVVLQQSVDLFAYECLYKHAKFPTNKDYRKHLNEQRRK